VSSHEECAGVDLFNGLCVLQTARSERLDHLRIVYDMTEGRHISTRSDRLLGLLHGYRHPKAEALN
jgi:hypothetical protein